MEPSMIDSIDIDEMLVDWDLQALDVMNSRLTDFCLQIRNKNIPDLNHMDEKFLRGYLSGDMRKAYGHDLPEEVHDQAIQLLLKVAFVRLEHEFVWAVRYHTSRFAGIQGFQWTPMEAGRRLDAILKEKRRKNLIRPAWANVSH